LTGGLLPLTQWWAAWPTQHYVTYL